MTRTDRLPLRRTLYFRNGSITSFFSCWANVRFSPLNRTYAELWLQSAIGRDRATKGAFVRLRRDS